MQDQLKTADQVVPRVRPGLADEKELVGRVMRTAPDKLTEPEARACAHSMMQYSAPSPNSAQLAAFGAVRAALTDAAVAILLHAPACADRSVAIRKLREARMDANAAIALEGLV